MHKGDFAHNCEGCPLQSLAGIWRDFVPWGGVLGWRAARMPSIRCKGSHPITDGT
jgi:hypothetical protein